MVNVVVTLTAAATTETGSSSLTCSQVRFVITSKLIILSNDCLPVSIISNILFRVGFVLPSRPIGNYS